MFKFTAFILIYSIMGLTTASVAQEYKWEPLSPVKGVFGDAGIGADGFGIGAGVRYMFIGLNLGLTGIANSSPAYAQQYPPITNFNRNNPLPSGYEEDRFLSSMINGDLIFYMDYFEKLSFNVSLGYYAKNDSILAKRISDGSRYLYKNETESGLCYGLGMEYVLNESINAGAGFHSQRGVIIRLTYFWY